MRKGVIEWSGQFPKVERRGPKYARLSMANGALAPEQLFELWRARDLAEFIAESYVILRRGERVRAWRAGRALVARR